MLRQERINNKYIIPLDRNLEQRFEIFVAKYEEELEQFQEESQVMMIIEWSL